MNKIKIGSENNKLIINDYRHNIIFRNFVQKYCKKHDVDTIEALQHEIVKQVWRMYTEV